MRLKEKRETKAEKLKQGKGGYKNFNSARGITLIALVITIIVLLILAGVSVATLTGDNGVLQKAVDAKEKNEIAKTEERIKLAVGSSYVDGEGKINYQKLISELTKEFEQGNYEINPDDSNAESWTITVGNAKYELENENYVAPTAVYAYKAKRNGEAKVDTLLLSSEILTKATGYEEIDLYRKNEVEFDISNGFHSADQDSPWLNENGEYIVYIDIYNKIAPKSMQDWFWGLSNLIEVKNIANIKTDNVTSMTNLFAYCENIEILNISSFNTSNVEYMNTMFAFCSKLNNVDLSSFNTEKVYQMQGMFIGCSSLELLDLSSFNTKNTKYMGSMFFNSSNLKTILAGDGWDTEDAYTDYMFMNCGTNNVTKNN